MKILLFDDNDIDRTYVKRLLKNIENADVYGIGSEQEFRALNALDQFDIVLLDYLIPGVDTLSVVDAFAMQNIPVLMLTGMAGTEAAVESMKHGAYDFIIKEQLSEVLLKHSIERARERHEAKRVLREQQEELAAANEQLLQKNAELEIAKQQQMKVFSQMAHDLRSPLQTIIGFSEILSIETQSDRDKKWLDAIFRNGNSLLELINDLMQLSRIAAGRIELVWETVSISNLIEEVSTDFSLRCKAKGLAWHAENQSAAKCLLVDKTRLMQILSNVVSNAIKYTEAGSISLIVKDIDENAVQFEVSDTGIGISAEDQENMFNSYFRTPDVVLRRIEGTGLGLVITASLVKMMQGVVGFESELGKGSRFWVKLPIVCHFAAA